MLPVAANLYAQVCPWVHTVNASHNGASNYGDGFDLSYPRIMLMHGMKAGIVDTPETGEGKDREDRDFNEVGSSLKAMCNAGMDIISAETCAKAADAMQGPEKGKINRVVKIQRGTGPEPLERFIKGKVYRWVHQHDAAGNWVDNASICRPQHDRHILQQRIHRQDVAFHQ